MEYMYALNPASALLMQVREMEDEVKKVNCDKDEILRRNKELERQTMVWTHVHINWKIRMEVFKYLY